MLYLASRSPRRHELLSRLDVPFQPIDLEVPEQRGADEAARDYVLRVAADKARAGLAQVGESDPTAVVLGSDTEVVLDDRVFGKPADAEDAADMLRSLSGRTHEVMTAVVLAAVSRIEHALVVSQVSFAELSPDAIARYVATGEPMGKAGGYAIQGGAERFVRHLSGSYSGVMGLPLHTTSTLLDSFGVSR